MTLALSAMGGLVMASPARHINKTILPREPEGEPEAHNYNKNILPRDSVDVSMCVSSPWQGCSHFVIPVDKCKNVKVPYGKAISSVGPIWGARCDFWTNRQCNGDIIRDIMYPGYALMPKGWNDKIRSYACWRD